MKLEEKMSHLDQVLHTTSDKNTIAWMKTQLINAWNREGVLAEARTDMECELVAVIQQNGSRGIQRAVIAFINLHREKLEKKLEEFV